MPNGSAMGGRFDGSEQHLPPRAPSLPPEAPELPGADPIPRARPLRGPIRWIRSGAAYQATAAVLVVGVTAALLLGDGSSKPPPASQVPVEISVQDEGVAGLVYPARRPQPASKPKAIPVRDHGRRHEPKKRQAAPVELSAPASTNIAPPPAPAPGPAQPPPAKKRARPEPEPSEPAPPTPTRTLYRLTKPNGHYFVTIDPSTADRKEAFDGWDKVRLAFVWGNWAGNMKTLLLSDSTHAYVMLRKSETPEGVASLWWAGGTDGPFYCFVKAECAAIGDVHWYGYADPI
jgi:hypothetical protein